MSCCRDFFYDFISTTCTGLFSAACFCTCRRLCNYPLAVYMLTCTARISRFTRVTGSISSGEGYALTKVLRHFGIYITILIRERYRQCKRAMNIYGSFYGLQAVAAIENLFCRLAVREIKTAEINVFQICAALKHALYCYKPICTDLTEIGRFQILQFIKQIVDFNPPGCTLAEFYSVFKFQAFD